MGGRGVNGAPGREIRSKDEHFEITAATERSDAQRVDDGAILDIMHFDDETWGETKPKQPKHAR